MILRILFITSMLCTQLIMAADEARRPYWLPESAVIIFSSQWEDGLLSDATFKIKAKITEAEFTSVVKQLELTPHTKNRKYSDDIMWLQGYLGGSDKKWDPMPSIDTTFVRQSKRYWQLAKYEGGCIYYVSISH